MKDELIKRTNNFAHNAVKLAVSLPDSVLGKHIRHQLIRCSTSVAANYRAACLAQSAKSFVAKLSIVIEEADESIFWIEFMIQEKLISSEKCDLILKESKELTAIFVSSRKTLNSKIK